MAIKRYVADADTTITNAFKTNLIGRGTGSNMGLSDVLEVFSLYGQTSGSDGLSQELSRFLVRFPISSITSDRTNLIIPSSGSVDFYLRLYDVKHIQTLPRNATYKIYPVDTEWQEGNGLDMETYLDETRDGVGANWINASQNTAWGTVGGDFDTSATTTYAVTQPLGTEDIEIDVTRLVEEWLSNSRNNYGIGLQLTSEQESYYSSSLGANSGSLIHNTTGSHSSYYTKKVFARGSEYWFKRPCLEARWDDTRKDDRGNIIFSSSRVGNENLQVIYMYNYIRGRLVDLPIQYQNRIMVSLYSGSTSPTGSKLLLPYGGGVLTANDVNITGGWVSTGVYTASFSVTASSTPLSTIFDVWHSGSTEFFTGSFSPKLLSTQMNSLPTQYFSSITNLKNSYRRDEEATFRVYFREQNWNPTIYNRAVSIPERFIVASSSYEVYRSSDDYVVIPFGTGSRQHTFLSYDVSGNFFNLDMRQLEPGYMYGIRLAIFDDYRNIWSVQKNSHKFRVE